MPASADDLFPPSPRVIYEHAPLIRVVCQLRYPSLLRIESRPPDEFQERIRGMFPLFERTPNPLPVDLPKEIAQLLRLQVSGTAYEFLTEDRSTTVTLTPESLALTTTSYRQWEVFRDHLRTPLAALVDIYKPSFFTRVGLRYQDMIDRNAVGLRGRPWSQLLRREILGELALPNFEGSLEQIANRTIRLKLPDGTGSVLMRHGLAQVQGSEEICYMIDFDFFTEQKTEVRNAEATLDHFNGIAGSAFRWCITDTLRDALGPRQLAAAG